MMNNPKFLNLLAAVSILLLLSFLTYWNVQNYHHTKAELQQDLIDQMDLASAEYQDSVIQEIFQIIEIDSFDLPDDEDFRTLNIGVNIDRHSALSHDRAVFTGTLEDRRVNVQTHTINGKSVDSDSSLVVMYDQERDRKIVVWNNDISSGEMKLEYRSDPIKGIDIHERIGTDTLIVHSTFETSGKESLPRLYVKIDSIYTNRLKKARLEIPHELKIFDRTTDSIKVPDLSVAFKYGNFLDAGRPYAIFPNYKKYILKKIWPSIFLSFALFSVVAISFLLILRSWLAQTRLTKVKNEFISNMTHELKTPISTVGVALEALESYGAIDDPKKRKEYLDISKHELDRLKILVDKVLKMSTLEQGVEALNIEDVDLSKLTAQMMHSMSLHFEKHEAQVDYKEEGSDFIVKGDKVHLVNVLYNLIDNAIKYSGDQPQVQLHLSSYPDHINISVSDNGPGIAKEYISKIFDRLFRVPTNDLHNVKGHGLGLHYVKTVVERHGGRAKVSSKVGVGTSFVITIPKKNA